jgi:hypothetical protein
MPVYHFTHHAYRSWSPDHPRGYTKKGAGYLPADKEAADAYDNAAKQDPVLFDEQTQRKLLELTREICEREKWELVGAGFDPTHGHYAIAWKFLYPWEEVDRRLKNLLTLRLNRLRGTPGKRWFVRRHGAPRRVKGMKHLRYLLFTYFPDHPGIFWRKRIREPRSPKRK